MPVPWLENEGILDPGDAGRGLAITGGPLRLLRATPTGPGHAYLEYETSRATPIAAQWSDDPDALERTAAQTRDASGAPAEVVRIRHGAVLLQPQGADRTLTALAAMLRRPGAVLVSHRAERRAVLRIDDGAQTRYAKLYRRRRLEPALAAHRAVLNAQGRSFQVAEIDSVDPAAGVACFAALQGPTLEARADVPEAMHAAGVALASLHRLPVAPGLPVHTLESERAVVAEWAERTAPFRPDVAAAVADTLRDCPSPREHCPAMIHRDFYDKQVVLGPGHAALLDFDLLSGGDPRLDAGNFLAHIALRAAEGRLRSARAAAEAFRDGYGAEPDDGTDLYERLTCLRLACVYSLRPVAPKVVEHLLERAGADNPWATA